MSAQDQPHDPDAGMTPAFAAPPGACDAHFHVFGREDQYPYDHSDLRYKPPYEPLDAYMKLARRIGFQRFVFVQRAQRDWAVTAGRIFSVWRRNKKPRSAAEGAFLRVLGC